jgi:endonuclease VIII
MPEGDTIFRAARAMNHALAGKKVTRFESALPKLTRVDEDTPLTGRTIESVTSAGKWNLIRFSGDLILLTHMRMNGSWHLYRPGERWQRPRNDMRVVIETADFVAVGFNVPVAEFHTEQSLRRKPELRDLGEDLLSEGFDVDEALQRLKCQANEEIGIALLDQRVMAGIGNVYKSEICFACKVNPFARIQSVSDEQLRCIVETARKFLKANVREDSGMGIATYTGFRRTTNRDNRGERLWVYGRRGLRCRVCGTNIEARKDKLDARISFWCPKCQPLAAELTAEAQRRGEG